MVDEASLESTATVMLNLERKVSYDRCWGLGV